MIFLFHNSFASIVGIELCAGKQPSLHNMTLQEASRFFESSQVGTSSNHFVATFYMDFHIQNIIDISFWIKKIFIIQSAKKTFFLVQKRTNQFCRIYFLKILYLFSQLSFNFWESFKCHRIFRLEFDRHGEGSDLSMLPTPSNLVIPRHEISNQSKSNFNFAHHDFLANRIPLPTNDQLLTWVIKTGNCVSITEIDFDRSKSD